MSELKTLKDLEVEDMSDRIVMSYKLKQEAIKWARVFGTTLSLNDWIKFFNITEEDISREKGERSLTMDSKNILEKAREYYGKEDVTYEEIEEMIKKKQYPNRELCECGHTKEWHTKRLGWCCINCDCKKFQSREKGESVKKVKIYDLKKDEWVKPNDPNREKDAPKAGYVSGVRSDEEQIKKEIDKDYE